MSQIIALKKSRGRLINTELPNGHTFTAYESDMSELFDNPEGLLNQAEKDGLLKLALAIIFADKKKAQVGQA